MTRHVDTGVKRGSKPREHVQKNGLQIFYRFKLLGHAKN
jgi:hypothetical protein